MNQAIKTVLPTESNFTYGIRTRVLSDDKFGGELGFNPNCFAFRHLDNHHNNCTDLGTQAMAPKRSSHSTLSHHQLGESARDLPVRFRLYRKHTCQCWGKTGHLILASWKERTYRKPAHDGWAYNSIKRTNHKATPLGKLLRHISAFTATRWFWINVIFEQSLHQLTCHR